MWKLGKEYLQGEQETDCDKPSSIIFIIVGSLALYFAVKFIYLFLLYPFTPHEIGAGGYTGLQSFYVGFISFSSVAIPFLPVLIHLRRTLNCSFTNVFLGKNRFSMIWFFASIAATWAVNFFVLIYFGCKFRSFFPPLDQVIPILLLTLTILFQSLAEELVFRGYFSKAVYLRGLGIISVFIIIPFTFALYHHQFSPDAFLGYFEFGVFFSYFSLRTGGLQLSTAVHFANNSFVVLGGNWIMRTGQSDLLLLQTVEMMVMALLLETVLLISKMRSRNAGDVSSIGNK
jgi:membrane protease YdiL (CAAX protease family)